MPEDPSPEKIAEHLQRIERQVGMADGVITALNDFAKLPTPNLQAVSLEPQFKEILELNPLPPEVEMLLEFPAGFPPVQADPNQLRIVFSNLIRNARDAMPDGGLLTIRGNQTGSTIEISVADTGVGHQTGRSRSDHGAALYDQGARDRIGACNRASDPGSNIMVG